MVRLIAPNGATVDVSAEKAERLAGQGFRALDGKPARRSRKPEPEAVSPHAGLKVAELKAEIERRNEGREGEAILSAEGNKPDLVAVLDADDLAQSVVDALDAADEGTPDPGAGSDND